MRSSILTESTSPIRCSRSLVPLVGDETTNRYGTSHEIIETTDSAVANSFVDNFRYILRFLNGDGIGIGMGWDAPPVKIAATEMLEYGYFRTGPSSCL